ncbi:MAG TPA: pyridoxamine 5'-phosphate oxidase family protein [Candidatus Angelobacter sp.]
MAFGSARKIADPEQKTRALRVISEHVLAGRWNDVRRPTEKELKATAVLEVSIEEASAKVRVGPPLDDEDDYSLPIWAGILPLSIEPKTPYPIQDSQMASKCRNILLRPQFREARVLK